MGKRSKRRGGGGSSAKASSGGDADQPLVSHEALMQVTAPKSLKGIFSTNDEPTCCVFCNKSVLSAHRTYTRCCGKISCLSCPISIVDIFGKERCASCNTLTSKGMAILRSEASLGKAWAEMLLGICLSKEEMHDKALSWYARSATKGNFVAFLQLSDVYREGKGVPQDLKFSEAYARKARELHSDCGILSNRALRSIAIDYINIGALQKASDILLGIVHEVDENALDDFLCEAVATHLPIHVNPKIASGMYAKAFCYGRIRSATNASISFFLCDKPALSKLWLDVAHKTKTLYEISQLVDGRADRSMSVSWDHYECERNDVRSLLREMRNSCGGCSAALTGERRKYCRCCRTYCYCNEDCQKQHWENGHREECKEVEEHMRNIRRAIRLGRFDWANEME